jgi:hypothetical protein
VNIDIGTNIEIKTEQRGGQVKEKKKKILEVGFERRDSSRGAIQPIFGDNPSNIFFLLGTLFMF